MYTNQGIEIQNNSSLVKIRKDISGNILIGKYEKKNYREGSFQFLH